MSKTGIAILILCLAAMTQCYKVNPHYNEYLGKMGTSFADSLYSHFPDYLFGNGFQASTIFPTKCIDENQCGSFLIRNTNKDTIEKIEQILIKNYAQTHFFENPCRLIIDPDTIHEQCDPLSSPFPNFPKIFERSVFSAPDSTRIDIAGYEIYVIDVQPGEFIEKQDLPEGYRLPIYWKHGYSKGIALNHEEVKILYWFQIW